MSEPTARIHNRKRRRATVLSLSLLATLAASGLIFSCVEKVRDASDRAY